MVWSYSQSRQNLNGVIVDFGQPTFPKDVQKLESFGLTPHIYKEFVCEFVEERSRKGEKDEKR